MTNFEICENVVTKYIGDNSSFVIPNSCCIDGINKEISTIKESMFKCCRSIENIEIEDGIKIIEKELKNYLYSFDENIKIQHNKMF